MQTPAFTLDRGKLRCQAPWRIPREHEIVFSAASRIDSPEYIDWSECPLVEVNPRVQAGAPALGGTRMPVDAIVDNFEYGVDVAEIAEQFELPAKRVQAIVTYAQSHRVARNL